MIYLKNQGPCRTWGPVIPLAWSWRQDHKFHSSKNNVGRCHHKPTNQIEIKQKPKEKMFSGLSGTGTHGLGFVQVICTAGDFAHVLLYVGLVG